MKQATLGTGVALLALSALAATEAARADRTRPDLSGSWTLNEAMSETAYEKMRELRAGRRGGRGGFGGPPSGTGRGGRPGVDGWGGRRGGAAGGGAAGGGPTAGLDRGADALSIRQTADQISITDADDRLRILFTDGRKDARTGPRGDVATRAKWNGKGELVVKSKSRDGKRTEIFSLDSEDTRLLVDITVNGPMGEITFLRTYDRSAGGDAAAGDG